MIYRKIAILLVFIILILSSWACGKKAPPRMPVTENDVRGQYLHIDAYEPVKFASIIISV